VTDIFVVLLVFRLQYLIINLLYSWIKSYWIWFFFQFQEILKTSMVYHILLQKSLHLYIVCTHSYQKKLWSGIIKQMQRVSKEKHTSCLWCFKLLKFSFNSTKAQKDHSRFKIRNSRFNIWSYQIRNSILVLETTFFYVRVDACQWSILIYYSPI